MSTEYIERGALIAFVRGVRQRLPKDSKDFFTRDEMLLNFQQYIECQPAADVEPVVHGEWKIKTATEYSEMFDEEINIELLVCSVCDTPVGYPANYCPECGAHMDERSEHED